MCCNLAKGRADLCGWRVNICTKAINALKVKDENYWHLLAIVGVEQ
jgi:hypothetical protein